MKSITLLTVGFVAGFATLFVLVLIFGDYEDEPVASIPPPAQAQTQAVNSANAAPSQTGPSYEAVCDADTGNMTDPQIAAFSQQWVGQRFSGWRGYVYDVVSLSDGKYNLEIAMQERGLFWTRDVVIENIASDLAARLNVEQPVTLAGRIERVETSFEVMCNPLVVTDYVLQE